MKILLTTRREKAELRNPIAILDLAAYARAMGHSVDCYYIDQILPGGNRNGNGYDLVGLSVLQVEDEKQPLKDAISLKRRFKTQVVVGGKWTQTLSPDEKASLAKLSIQVHSGPGEKYFSGTEIDFLRYPSWDKVDFDTLGDAHADLMSTRGCPYHCNFCHNTERKLSFFSAKRTADNIELLFKLGLPHVSFVDDIFTLRPTHMEALYRELSERGVSIAGRNEFFTHVHHINQETLRWVRAYRPFKISVGVESGDDRMLNIMGKGFDAETAYARVKMLAQSSSAPVGSLFIVGFPGETRESLQNTLNFVRRLRPYSGCWVSYYQPVPRTKGYELAEARAGKIRRGRRNMQISYVEPGLTRRILFTFNYAMMDYADVNSLRSRIIYKLLKFLPVWFLFSLRLVRQRRRLARGMQLDG